MTRTAAAAAILSVIAVVIPTHTHPAKEPRHMILTTPPEQLLATGIPIGNAAKTATRVVVHSLPYDAHTGDEVSVLGRFQVTSPTNYNVMVGSYIVRADTPDGTDGTIIARAVAMNVTPDIHHLPMERSDYDAPPGPARWYYNLVVYAASSKVVPGDQLVVDPYGKVTLKL